MKTSVRRPIRAGEDFWRVIERCLIEFHGWAPAPAHERVERFRSDLAGFWADDEDDLIVNSEPFELAGDMAGRYLGISSKWPRYAAIIEEVRRELAAEHDPAVGT